jgi:hypothetical protein
MNVASITKTWSLLLSMRGQIKHEQAKVRAVSALTHSRNAGSLNRQVEDIPEDNVQLIPRHGTAAKQEQPLFF